MLRAYDKATGKEVGAVYMPAPQSGSPMTYMLNGKQYIVDRGQRRQLQRRTNRVQAARITRAADRRRVTSSPHDGTVESGHGLCCVQHGSPLTRQNAT